MSQLLAATLREDPAEAEIVSHKLMLRAAMMRKLAAGIYTFLPLGWRVVHKVERIVRAEMDRAGAQEVLLPAMLPAELWKETGRWDVYGKELMRIKDRHEREFCLGPTHEEIITNMVRREVKSYRQLPLNLYQIQTKFRDEIRPRFGLMRAREFIMKDAYSFDRDEEGLEKSYQNMYQTYCRIFDRCGLNYKVVEADPGAIGGSSSQEFMIMADSGEDEIAVCDKCDYVVNRGIAEIRNPKSEIRNTKSKGPKPEKVSTPNVRTVEDLEKFFKVKADKFIKTLVYQTEKGTVVALVRGDHSISDAKLRKLVGCEELFMADEKTIKKVTGAPVGFAGPLGLSGVKIYADHDVEGMADAISGANAVDAHMKHIYWGRDFKADKVGDIRFALDNDPCPKCKGTLKITRGIEVGHVFKLGTKYSAKMKATFLDEDNKEKPFIMGCYGIGVSRTAQAAIEQNHDQFGIKWPLSLAPYQVSVIPINTQDKAQRETAEKIYQDLQKKNIEVVLDDRPDSPGVKFKDADLIGFPFKVVIGKTLKDNKVEFQERMTGQKQLVDLGDIVRDLAAKCT